MSKVLGIIAFTLLGVAGFYWVTVVQPQQAHDQAIKAQDLGSEGVMNISDKAVFDVEIARTQSEQEKGLSGRAFLPKTHGMLFAFEKPDTHGIWMKDMQFFLDIIWFDEKGKIIHIEKNISPETYPRVFIPDSPDMYVLEINEGLADQFALKVGDYFTILDKPTGSTKN